MTAIVGHKDYVAGLGKGIDISYVALAGAVLLRGNVAVIKDEAGPAVLRRWIVRYG